MQGSVVDFRALAAHEDVHQPSLALIKTGASEPCGIQGCPIDAGSPSSSKSCREGQPGTNTSAETAQVFVATFFMPDATQPEKPVLLRKRFSRKPPPRQQPIFSHLNTTQEGTLTMAGGLGLPQQAPAAEAAPQGRSKRAPKPRKMWEEVDINEPTRTSKRVDTNIPAPRAKSPQESALPGAGPHYDGSGSPLSDDSASTAPTRRPYVLMPFCRPSCHDEADYQDEEEEDGKAKKHGGPCYICWETESTAWRLGVDGGLFPGLPLCNSHGTLDRRGRLSKYVDAEGIRDLHESSMSNEEKAAAAVAFYKKGRAVTRSPTRAQRQRRNGGEEAAGLDGARPRVSGRVKGRAVPLYGTEEVAQHEDQGRAELNWGMQSPGQPRLASQASRLRAEGSSLPMGNDLNTVPSSAAGQGKKRKADNDISHIAAADVPAGASKKRLCFHTQKGRVALNRAVSSSQHRQLQGTESGASDMEEDIAGLDGSILEERLSGMGADPGMVSAAASLLSMRRSSSSEMDNMDM